MNKKYIIPVIIGVVVISLSVLYYFTRKPTVTIESLKSNPQIKIHCTGQSNIGINKRYGIQLQNQQDYWLLVDTTIKIKDLKKGDLIVFKGSSSQNNGNLITHPIKEVYEHSVLIEGIFNNTPDSFPITDKDLVGKVIGLGDAENKITWRLR